MLALSKYAVSNTNTLNPNQLNLGQLNLATHTVAEHVIQSRKNICIHAPHDVKVSLHDTSSTLRHRLEQFVKDLFFQRHHAEVQAFMPTLMALSSPANDALLAVCGLRNAQTGTLFLERYLDAPIEKMLSAVSDQKVARDNITEIGNLAVSAPENIRCLLTCINLQLHQTDTQWAVFTGIRSLKNALHKLNIPVMCLGMATLDAMPETEQAAWGSYYDEKPEVMAIQRYAQA